MLALICLGWKLSTRLEYWWWLLCTPPCSSSSFFFLPLSLSHPRPHHLSSLHILYILSAQLISCLLSLSPLFTLLISPLSPMQLHFVDPNFPSTSPLLLSISASDLALPLPLLSLSLTGYIIRLHSFSSFLPFFVLLFYQFLPSSLLSASPFASLVFSALAFLLSLI